MSHRECVLSVRYAKQAISLAPNNPSAWNYLRGVLDYTHTPYANLRTFVEMYTDNPDRGFADEIDLEDPQPSEGAELPCSAAIEFMAEVLESEGQNAIPKAVEVRSIVRCSGDAVRSAYTNMAALRDARKPTRHNPEEVGSASLLSSVEHGD